MDEITPGWWLFSIGPYEQWVDLGGADVWAAEWTPTGEYITVENPEYSEQLHQFEIYEIELHDGTLRFAAAEFHYGLWGFYLEGHEDGAPDESDEIDEGAIDAEDDEQ